MTSRERIYRTLAFVGVDRAARQLWTLPWASIHYPHELAAIEAEYPSDFGGVDAHLRKTPVTVGNATEIGTYIDEWGCAFQNIQRGVIGEVKAPLVADADWRDTHRVHIPEELLTIDVEKINEACAKSDRFIIAGCCPRPFEQLQFIRTTEMLYMDLADPPTGLLAFMERMHDFYCRLLTAWAKTDVDALSFMDDWGSQRGLLIHPDTWVALFKRMYRDYSDIAHRYGKKLFMHSDGHTLLILPHLIDIGLDAINTQIFCIGIENLKPFKGKITFWGEMDRQNLLPYGTQKDIDQAVRLVYDTLWAHGGCIAQCEFSAGTKPENVAQVFKSWNTLTGARACVGDSSNS